MAHRFIVDSSPPGSPAPATPDKKFRANGFSFMGNYPSTTPAGIPPPSSAGSFTPAGAPTASYYGSPLGGQPDSKPLFGGQSINSPANSLFGHSSISSNAPLGRSIRGKDRQPSGLSRTFNAGDDNPDEDEDAEGELDLPPQRGSLFRMSSAGPAHSGNDFNGGALTEIEQYIDRDLAAEDYQTRSREASDDGDMFLNMRHDDRPYGQPIIGEESDLMMLNTPAATSRVRREAESIFKRSSAQLGLDTHKYGFQFATIAKDLYSPLDSAHIAETPDLILKTEDLVCRLYEEGVGTEDDTDKMDNSLASITYQLVRLWNDYVDELPPPEGEDIATVGPGADSEPFEKAAYVAHLILRLHHTRFQNENQEEKTPPLPETLFHWMHTSHNLYPDQIREIHRHQPSPACHTGFWHTVRSSLLRGDVASASQLLRDAGWENVRRGLRGDKLYSGQVLENVRRFVDATCDMLDQCPGKRSEWDVWNSNWTLFRIQARGALDRLKLFAEGRGQSLVYPLDDKFNPQPQSLSTMAKKASSQLPWDFYENLQTIYEIVLGDPQAIVDVAQDWCEATVGLCGWLDDGNQRYKSLRLSRSQNFRTSRTLGSGDYFERLATAFHIAIESDMHPNSMNPVEVAIASTFEGNVNAVISFLRIWSLPVACTVAEIASLGGWLPPSDAFKSLPTDTLDLDDLALLGVKQPTSDEVDGIKDTTLVTYARELAGIDHLSPQRDGWEMAIEVLGRMDSPEKSEETVGELLRDLLATLDEYSGETVDKIWRILNDLGMINYAEETAETFAEILSNKSHRYGEALWYYALSHRTDKVREVLNLLMSYSLVQSTAYPAEKDLDEDLSGLLRKRTETLEKKAKQDLEAAQLLGRMLSGYATLRKFYELRDQEELENISSSKALLLKRQAAVALVAVVSSSDDNIRGGLYDGTRDAVVSEDFLLALLGEATVFINHSPPLITLEQIDTLLKAIEDIEAVGDTVYSTCEDFFNLVLSSAQGLKGSNPADLMKKSTNLGASSYMMNSTTMLANHMQKSMLTGGKVQREWDWRKQWLATTKADDVLRKLRQGLARDLAALWLEDADGVAIF